MLLFLVIFVDVPIFFDKIFELLPVLGFAQLRVQFYQINYIVKCIDYFLVNIKEIPNLQVTSTPTRKKKKIVNNHLLKFV